jgi:hypothetical protein
VRAGNTTHCQDYVATDSPVPRRRRCSLLLPMVEKRKGGDIGNTRLALGTTPDYVDRLFPGIVYF